VKKAFGWALAAFVATGLGAIPGTLAPEAAGQRPPGRCWRGQVWWVGTAYLHRNRPLVVPA